MRLTHLSDIRSLPVENIMFVHLIPAETSLLACSRRAKTWASLKATMREAAAGSKYALRIGLFPAKALMSLTYSSSLF